MRVERKLLFSRRGCMRNKIPCSAERLSLLDPPMIQSVVDRNAFHLGTQYLSENRVRIVEADEAQISSAVIGNSGLYEQTIRLKDGHLVSKCSCSLPEEPMCRHCIAVMLEFHRWVQPRAKKAKPTAPAPPEPSASACHWMSSWRADSRIEWQDRWTLTLLLPLDVVLALAWPHRVARTPRRGTWCRCLAAPFRSACPKDPP